MKNRSDLLDYQEHSIKWILDRPFSGLFLDMGLGKTISTLTAINHLMYDELEVEKVLVIAPLKVAQNVWTDEVAEWEHVSHLKVQVVAGLNEHQRIAALRKKADIYTINRENVPWLVAFYGTAWPFDMVVIDELSSFKSPKAARFKQLRSVRPFFKRVVGLTGTPTPNGLIDLWSQMYLLDMGERLGNTISNYRDKYFNEGARRGHVVFKYELKSDSKEQIYGAVEDICISMKSEDYIQLPELVHRVVPVKFPDRLMQEYLKFERDQVMQIIDKDITAANAAVLTGKLLQFANGAIYDADKIFHEVHQEKIDVLGEIVEAANGKPILVATSFAHDVIQINKHLKAFRPRKLENNQDIKDWNAGKVPFMLTHPASTSHGLNLQFGGEHLVWFGHTWSLEYRLQFIKRIHRRGVAGDVLMQDLVSVGTADEDALAATDSKSLGQETFLKAIKARVDRYR